MARFRALAVPVAADGTPPELHNSRAGVWQSADACRMWLEDHRLRRRMRDASDLEQMTSDERRLFAAGLWRQRVGGPDEWLQHVRIDGQTDRQRNARILNLEG